jgi:hypothetical protein
MTQVKVKFSSITIGSAFQVIGTTFTGFRRKDGGASLYNDFDEYVGRQDFKADELVFVWM